MDGEPSGISLPAGPDVLVAAFGPAETVADGLVASSGSFTQFDVVRVSDGAVVGTIDDLVNPMFWPTFSHDGRWIAMGSQFGRLLLVDVSALLAGAPREDWFIQIDASIEPTAGAVAEGQLAATTHGGRTLRIWSVVDRAPWFDIPISTTATAAVAFSRDGKSLLYEAGRGVLGRLRLDPTELESLARSSASRSFTVAECERFLIDTDCSVYEET